MLTCPRVRTKLIYINLPDGMVFICIAIVLFWKVFKRTKFLRGTEVDLTSDLQDINDYTEEVSRYSHIPVCKVIS